MQTNGKFEEFIYQTYGAKRQTNGTSRYAAFLTSVDQNSVAQLLRWVMFSQITDELNNVEVLQGYQSQVSRDLETRRLTRGKDHKWRAKVPS